VLLGGDPGIGKSTLLMQMAGGLAAEEKRVLYVSAEESVNQTAMRAQRLGIRTASVEVASESNLELIVELAKKIQPDVLIVDSIQTVYLSSIPSAPGTVSQVRECASHLMGLAKGSGMSVVLIGHVTKDGNIAGPKTLEHIVDTVLSFEGDPSAHYRLLRSLKNRFGATHELGVFQMNTEGLKEISNPSELFLAERGDSLIGSTVFAAMEGTRPLLCEVQALIVKTYMAAPRRTSIGYDTARAQVLAAVLDKHLGCDLAHHDAFVNVVGGLKLTEPAADLAVAAAILSSLQNRDLNPNWVFVGEIGLTGEVRTVSQIENRIREARKLGFEMVILPEGNRKHLSGDFKSSEMKHLAFVRDLRSLQEFLLGAPESNAKHI
jgi:DNA repair protein RadA/Sms